MFDPMQTNTIGQVIKFGKGLDISHSKMYLKAAFSNNGDKIIINYTSHLDKYFDYLKKFIVEVTLTDSEYLMYRFQPKRLCYDYYNTTELWSLILRINNLTSASQFDLIKVKLFTEDIFDLLNEILILEKESITQNNVDIYES